MIIAKDLAEAPPMRHAFGVIPGGIREASWVNGSPDPATLASIEPSIGARFARVDGTGRPIGESNVAVRRPPSSSAYEGRLLVH